MFDILKTMTIWPYRIYLIVFSFASNKYSICPAVIIIYRYNIYIIFATTTILQLLYLSMVPGTDYTSYTTNMIVYINSWYHKSNKYKYGIRDTGYGS